MTRIKWEPATKEYGGLDPTFDRIPWKSGSKKDESIFERPKRSHQAQTNPKVVRAAARSAPSPNPKPAAPKPAEAPEPMAGTIEARIKKALANAAAAAPAKVEPKKAAAAAPLPKTAEVIPAAFDPGQAEPAKELKPDPWGSAIMKWKNDNGGNTVYNNLLDKYGGFEGLRKLVQDIGGLDKLTEELKNKKAQAAPAAAAPQASTGNTETQKGEKRNAPSPRQISVNQLLTKLNDLSLDSPKLIALGETSSIQHLFNQRPDIKQALYKAKLSGDRIDLLKLRRDSKTQKDIAPVLQDPQVLKILGFKN